MTMIKRFTVSPLIFLAVALINQTNANDNPSEGKPDPEIAIIDDATAKKRYQQLMDKVEGNDRSCMVAGSFEEETLAALTAFGKTARFIDLDSQKPIKVELPENFYHPLGRTITFDEFELAIYQTGHSNLYISMSRTPEGLKLEPKIALQMEDDTLLCVRYLSATVKYKSQ